jgi:hypothetical protein
MRQLPDGIADFPTLIRKNYLYADKTIFLYDLITSEKPYFLSRPRRFGKTLLVSTLAAILKGQRELFKGLWIDSSDYTWEPYPVIRLSLSSIETDSIKALKSDLISDLQGIAKSENLALQGATPPAVFKSLFDELYWKYNKKVAVLIDEYDAPILSKIANPKKAEGIRSTLKDFYNVLKDKEPQRGFTFITGVTKFTKTSIFSTLNNLDDLTLDENYASICGFTLEEFDTVFQEYMEPLLKSLKEDGAIAQQASIGDLRQLILDWYDGYSWDGKTKILNPWSILKVFQRGHFGNHWMRTGSPRFLVELTKAGKLNFNELKNPQPIVEDLNVIELGEELNPVPLMFQSGYLTVEKVDKTKEVSEYQLGFPTLEVKASIIPLLLSLEPIQQPLVAYKQCKNMLNSLINLDPSGFQKSLGQYLSIFPHNLDIPLEAYYHNLFQSALLIAGAKVNTEGSVGDGRYDARYTAPDGTIFVFELKYCSHKGPKGKELSELQVKKNMEESAKEAMLQIEKKNYTKPFRGTGAAIYKVALAVGGRTEVLSVFKKE